MSRHHVIDGVAVPYTADEEAAQDASEAIVLAEQAEYVRTAAIKADIAAIENHEPRAVRELGVRLGDQASIDKDALIAVERTKL